MSFCQEFVPEKCTCLKPEPKEEEEVFYTSAFNAEAPTLRPSIFLWMFLTEQESKFILQNDIGPQELMLFIEKKIGTDESLLSILLLETIKYCRKHFTDPRRASAFVGTFYYTHRYFTASGWRTSSEVYIYFRESMLCQSIESPPKCMEIFDPEETKEALLFFFETYLRNLPLINIMHLPHYKLNLKLQEEAER